MTAPAGTSGAFPRLGFLEAMEISRLAGDGHSNGIHQFMSHRPAWRPGAELPWSIGKLSNSQIESNSTTRAYGGHVYIQAPLAAVRVVEEDDEKAKAASNTTTKGKFGIHVSMLFVPELRVYRI